ncbi:glycoside hydrolase family 3 C-terminal domain-containing protein [Granulicella sp. S156]|uniref:glycoside hydrolase family 3 C-terminal domain-containing protein n=1 Tax=Granulicella sp. S156 TaxID=1747224 RepID=UPI0020B17509|nr:glycoside hydrolase family 3 C-terminal domain-containing protein [Granulicella sp. S156]
MTAYTAVTQSVPVTPVYSDPHANPESRITSLLAAMTLDEKIHALSTDPSVPRLGIVGSNHVEGLHGLALGGPGHWEGHNLSVIPTTQFPQVRGLGQTWDPALLQKAAAQEAYEARFAFGKYHRGGLVVRAPNADLSRDPRWGRSEESYGEDPFLVGTLATAFSRGLQGNDPHVWMTASLLKHFLANSNEDGRGGSSSNFDTRLFHEYYSVPFRMAIEDGHADAMMTSYNAWNGVAMAVNPVVRDVVMKEWGLDGIVCTDGGALTNLVTEHHAFPTMAEAAAASIHAGINQFLDDYQQPVRDALTKKLITEQDIDRNLRGVYRVMLHLGLLDPAEDSPYSHIGEINQAAGDPWNTEDPRALVRRVTDESIVLLKNTGRALPLDAAKLKSIAVIGPWADTVALDWYSGTPPLSVTPVEGIRRRIAGASVTFNDGKDEAAAAALAAQAQIAVVIVGNHPTCDAGWNKCAQPSEGKEAIDRTSLTLPEESLVKAVLAANPHTVVVLQTSFPYTTNWTQEHAPAILEMTHNSEEQGTALADVLFGDYNPAGRLTQTWPASLEQLPPMMDYDLRHGRTYLYAQKTPLYPFGFGLSYTSFAYGNLTVAQQGKSIAVQVTIANTGARDGDEVVQIYAAHQNSTVQRPTEELKAFQRVSLHAGEKRTVTFDIPVSSLAYWDDHSHRFIAEGDRVEFRAAASSADVRLRQALLVKP